jgi:hypothetical protein
VSCSVSRARNVVACVHRLGGPVALVVREDGTVALGLGPNPFMRDPLAVFDPGDLPFGDAVDALRGAVAVLEVMSQ